MSGCTTIRFSIQFPSFPSFGSGNGSAGNGYMVVIYYYLSSAVITPFSYNSDSIFIIFQSGAVFLQLFLPLFLLSLRVRFKRFFPSFSRISRLLNFVCIIFHLICLLAKLVFRSNFSIPKRIPHLSFDYLHCVRSCRVSSKVSPRMPELNVYYL